MSVRLITAALAFMMVQGVLFGIGAILVLATPLTDSAMQLMPWVVGISVIISVPVSWMIAPRLLSRFENRATSRPPAAAI